MDISKLSINQIELFAMGHNIAKQVFNVTPINADKKTKRKIRKWINKTYLDDEELPENLLKFLDKSRTDSEVMEFITECAEYIEENGTLKMSLTQKATAEFPEDVKNAFIYLIEATEYFYNVKVYDDKVVFVLEETAAYKRELILHTSEKCNLDSYDELVFGEAVVVKEENGYKLVCEAVDYEKDISLPLVIRFNNATTEIQIFNASHSEFFENPWETLVSLARDILGKRCLGDDYFNPKEKALIPLMKELEELSNWSIFDDDGEQSFEIIKEYVNRYKLTHLIKMIDKVKRLPKEKFSRSLALVRLTEKLNESVCEPLWRELYGLLVDSQSGYTDKINSYDGTQLNKTRKQIELNLRNLGYEGEYPTFRKKGAIKGIKLESSYNQTYFLSNEKNAEYFIQCKESVYGDRLQIQFLCGTALLKKGEAVSDIYSCCFNKKGRRLFKTVCWLEDEEEMSERYTSVFATVAAKKAECIKLTKREKELTGSESFSVWEFICVFLFMGGLFAVLMTAALFIILCLVDGIILGFSDIPDMIKQVPWWQLFLFEFVGFGGSMAVIEAKSKTK